MAEATTVRLWTTYTVGLIGTDTAKLQVRK
jgi:hypothetical protein